MNKKIIFLCAVLLTGCNNTGNSSIDAEASNPQSRETKVVAISDENTDINSNFKFTTKCLETTQNKTMFVLSGSVYEKGYFYEITDIAEELKEREPEGIREFYFLDDDTFYVSYDEDDGKYYYYTAMHLSYSAATLVNLKRQIASCSFELTESEKTNGQQIDTFTTSDDFYSFSILGGLPFEATTLTFADKILTMISGTLPKQYNSEFYGEDSDSLVFKEETTIYDIGKVEAPHEVTRYKYNDLP